MSRKFRKKPVTVEAVRWTGHNAEDIINFVTTGCSVYPMRGTVTIVTLEGLMTAHIGDWIIKGVRGEFYPCKHDIFRETYEELFDENPV